MSSEATISEPRTIYTSSRRSVVSWNGLVMEVADGGTSGWLRASGTAGPMSGELHATLTDGAWSRPLTDGEARMWQLAVGQAGQ
ncbi:hypothetical protein O9X98_09455 [Agrobacterium salinitolerans]|nr:hypothetical protein [Agrobacterium salinitolerans]